MCFKKNMLEKINIETSKKCYPKRLKRFFQNNLNYKTYSNFAPFTECTTVGSIPPEIVKLFEGKEKSSKIKTFLSALGKTSDAIRKTTNPEQYKEILQDNFKGIMPTNTQINIDYVGRGAFKRVYRLGLRDNSGKKLMHDKAFLIYDTDSFMFKEKSHGVYAEPNSWIYLEKNIGHKTDNTQFIRHYISDLKNGYSLTEFVDKEITKTSKRFDYKKILGLILTDGQNNPQINQKIYDIGGLQRCRDFLTDKVSLKYFKKIANRKTEKEREKVVEELSKQIKNKKTPLRDKIETAVEFYKKLPKWYWLENQEGRKNHRVW